jgi:hypothetical protein
LVFFAIGNLIYFSFKWYSTDLYRSLHEPTPCFFELTYVVCISLTGAFTFAVFGITRENYTELKVKLNVFARLLVDIFDDCRWLMRNLYRRCCCDGVETWCGSKNRDLNNRDLNKFSVDSSGRDDSNNVEVVPRAVAG